MKGMGHEQGSGDTGTFKEHTAEERKQRTEDDRVAKEIRERRTKAQEVLDIESIATLANVIERRDIKAKGNITMWVPGLRIWLTALNQIEYCVCHSHHLHLPTRKDWHRQKVGYRCEIGSSTR